MQWKSCINTEGKSGFHSALQELFVIFIVPSLRLTEGYELLGPEAMVSSCIREGSDWLLGEICSQKEWWGIRICCPGRWWGGGLSWTGDVQDKGTCGTLSVPTHSGPQEGKQFLFTKAIIAASLKRWWTGNSGCHSATFAPSAQTAIRCVLSLLLDFFHTLSKSQFLDFLPSPKTYVLQKRAETSTSYTRMGSV